MSEFSTVLKMYAECGLRSVDGWIALGREIASDAKSRLQTPYHGTLLPLYSRDQTHLRARAPSKRH